MDGLRREVRRSGRPMKRVINDALRAGLARESRSNRHSFVVRSRNLGLRPGLSLDDIEGLLDRVEGSRRP